MPLHVTWSIFHMTHCQQHPRPDSTSVGESTVAHRNTSRHLLRTLQLQSTLFWCSIGVCAPATVLAGCYYKNARGLQRTAGLLGVFASVINQLGVAVSSVVFGRAPDSLVVTPSQRDPIYLELTLPLRQGVCPCITEGHFLLPVRS